VKHCSPYLSVLHEQLNATYACQAVTDLDLDDLFDDGPGQTTIRKDASQQLKQAITKLVGQHQHANTPVIQSMIPGITIFSRLPHDYFVQLRTPRNFQRIFSDARNNCSNTVIVYLDIDILNPQHFTITGQSDLNCAAFVAYPGTEVRSIDCTKR